MGLMLRFQSTLDGMQCAARKCASCLDSSLVLRKAIVHAIEHESTAYVVVLDAKKAYDTMWIEGLFYQLWNIEIDNAL